MKVTLVGLTFALACNLTFGDEAINAVKDASQDAVDTLKGLAAEVQKELARENVHTMFDRTLRLKEMGLSYQPDLVAPVTLDPDWSDCQLRQFAGMKIFDVAYAIAFQKRQETADAMKAIEEVFARLDLRSHADWPERGFATMRKAAEDPEAIDVQQLLNELADSFVDEIPVAMSSPETAHYLIDAIYGLSIESSHVTGYFQRNDTSGTFRKELHAHKPEAGHDSWMQMVLRIYSAFAQRAAALGLVCESPEKLGVIRNTAELVEQEQAGKIPEETRQAVWNEIGDQVAAIREEILKPAAK